VDERGWLEGNALLVKDMTKVRAYALSRQAL
jgi:hypothetical protein